MAVAGIAQAPAPLRILVADDEPAMLRYMATLLPVEDFDLVTASGGKEAVLRFQEEPKPDLVLMDVVMPDQDGITSLQQIRELDPNANVVMLSCVSDTRRVVEAMKHGAKDYITKPFSPSDLELVVGNCRRRELGTAHHERTAPRTIDEIDDELCFIAASPIMHKLRDRAEQVARVNVPILLLGESGTGKEVLARLIHMLSPRTDRIFLKVNCAAMPPDLLESELFGYEAGAFTGANTAKPGKFEQANKGTILLDEIGEMPPSLQAKLLHVLQDGQFSRLGSRSVVKVDVRILAATNIDVRQALASGKLRQDLYYRLNAFTMHIPPLRDRKEEIPILLKHYITRYSERYACAPIPLSSLDSFFREYSWPGNVRELCNIVKRALVIGDQGAIVRELQEHVAAQHSAATDVSPKSAPPEAPVPPDGLKPFVRDVKADAEAEVILQALEMTNWNRREAAEILNISYRSLLYKIRQHRLTERSVSRVVARRAPRAGRQLQ